MEKLLEFTLSQHLSRYKFKFSFIFLNKFDSFSVNLIAAMGAIANIARQRPDYMSRVVQTFEALQGNYLFNRFKLF
jgi:hypothetical protein